MTQKGKIAHEVCDNTTKFFNQIRKNWSQRQCPQELKSVTQQPQIFNWKENQVNTTLPQAAAGWIDRKQCIIRLLFCGHRSNRQDPDSMSSFFSRCHIMSNRKVALVTCAGWPCIYRPLEEICRMYTTAQFPRAQTQGNLTGLKLGANTRTKGREASHPTYEIHDHHSLCPDQSRP